MNDGPDAGREGAISDEEIARVIKQEFKLALQACDELDAESKRRFATWKGRKQYPEEDRRSIADQIVALEWARSTRTYEACLALCRAGFGEQAAMLNRSLFEGMAVAHWVQANEKEAGDRFEGALRYDAHLAAERAESTRMWEEELDDEALKAARLDGDELETMKDKFGTYGERPWTGHRNLPALVRSIEDQWGDEAKRDLWMFHDIAHRDNNKLLHSTVVGLRRSFSRSVPEGAMVWVGPSNRHIAPALFGAHWTYSYTVRLAVKRFEFPDPEGLDKLIGEHQFLLFPFEPDDFNDVDRNDPCLCKSGQKYKRCHLEQVEIRKSLLRKRAL